MLRARPATTGRRGSPRRRRRPVPPLPGYRSPARRCRAATRIGTGAVPPCSVIVSTGPSRRPDSSASWRPMASASGPGRGPGSGRSSASSSTSKLTPSRRRSSPPAARASPSRRPASERSRSDSASRCSLRNPTVRGPVCSAQTCSAVIDRPTVAASAGGKTRADQHRPDRRDGLLRRGKRCGDRGTHGARRQLDSHHVRRGACPPGSGDGDRRGRRRRAHVGSTPSRGEDLQGRRRGFRV